MAERKTVVLVDPDLYMKRMLHYNERHSVWYIFRSIYVAIYLFIVGALLISQTTLHYGYDVLAGISLVVLALMVVVYGFVVSLHNKLMVRYG